MTTPPLGKVLPPHEFIGRSDRYCEFEGCNLPDRAAVHKAEYRNLPAPKRVPAGSHMWEKVTPLADGGTQVQTRGVDWTQGATVSLTRDDYERLMIEAGYEFKGVSDGTSTCWYEQQQRRAQRG